MTARLRQTATLGPRVAKQADLKSPPPLYQQRARERRRAMAVSAAAMLLIAASLAAIVLVRANNNKDDEAFTTAEAAPAEKPVAKQVKTQPAKPAAAAATAAPVKTAAIQPAEAKPAAPAQAATAVAIPEVGDAGPVPVEIAAAQQQAQAFADVQANASNASKALEQVADGNLPAELTAAIPTPRPTDTTAPGDNAEVEVASAAQAAAPKGTARILRDVTMRASGSKGAAPIGTIPAKATVELITCKSWCQVVYKGKRGWIYKGFVAR